MRIVSWISKLWVKEIEAPKCIEEKKEEVYFKWPNGLGNRPCVCPCGRELEQEEVNITWVSNTWGDSRTRGSVKCNSCGRNYRWNNVDWE